MCIVVRTNMIGPRNKHLLLISLLKKTIFFHLVYLICQSVTILLPRTTTLQCHVVLQDNRIFISRHQQCITTKN